MKDLPGKLKQQTAAHSEASGQFGVQMAKSRHNKQCGLTYVKHVWDGGRTGTTSLELPTTGAAYYNNGGGVSSLELYSSSLALIWDTSIASQLTRDKI